MKILSKLKFKLSLATIFFLAVHAQAQNLNKEVKTISLQTGFAAGLWNTSFDIPKFDTRKGQLLSVQIKVSGLIQYSVSGEFIAGEGSRSTFIGTLRSNFQLTDHNNVSIMRYEKLYTDSVENQKAQGSASVNTIVLPFEFEKAYFGTAEIMPFIIGSGSLRYNLASSGNASVMAFSGTSRTGAAARSQASVSIIYNYVSFAK